MAKGKVRNKGGTNNKGNPENQLLKKSFDDLSQDLQISVLLRLLGHSLTEPKSLDIFKFLCPKPEEYFTATILSSTQFGSNTVKEDICDIFKMHFYSVTENNEGNLINSLKYLFSGYTLNIKDFILENNVSFSRIISYLAATKGKKNLIKYLLEHKIDEELTFKDSMTEKNIPKNGTKQYSMYDIFGDLFHKNLKKHLSKSGIEQEQAPDIIKGAALNYYQKDIKKSLEESKETIYIRQKLSELIYVLFNNTQNIDKFLSQLDNNYTEITKSQTENFVNAAFNDIINYVINVFDEGFFFNCKISEQISFLETCSKFNPKDETYKAKLKIYNDIQILIKHQIINAEDCNFRKQVADFLYLRTEGGFQAIFTPLLKKVIKIDPDNTVDTIKDFYA
ncbi:MAG: hypothetical protein LN568_05620 [Rickettsia endosymbiont of Pseudomimeciton antennatum]|nr:hypothetical protein [Rickettsia endosymbiont of Pseudomimeciton antennatum]